MPSIHIAQIVESNFNALLEITLLEQNDLVPFFENCSEECIRFIWSNGGLDERLANKVILQCLKFFSTSEETINTVLRNVQKSDPLLYKNILDFNNKIDQAITSKLSIVIDAHFDELVEHLEPTKYCYYLIKNRLISSELYDLIGRKLADKGRESANCAFLTNISLTSGMSDHFRILLRMQSQLAHLAPELEAKVKPVVGTEEYGGGLELALSRLSVIDSSEYPIIEFPVDDEDEDSTSRKSYSIINSSSANSLNSDDDFNWEELEAGTDLVLRGYQVHLAEEAKKGRNVIVCAPTGSGKTLVGVDVLLSAFVRATAKKAKIAFIVPTGQLVDQQTSVIDKYCTHKGVRVLSLKGSGSGKSSTPKILAMQEYDVIVMTPQLLLNAFESTDSDLECLKISDFSVLIFDETHHTNKDHPYNKLMEKYFDAKKAGNPSLPQILGLTAFLGVGKADSELAAIDHVIKMCAQLDCKHLATISNEHMAELQTMVNSPRDEIYKVRSSSLDHPFAQQIVLCMHKVEAELRNFAKKIPDIMESPLMELLAPPSHKVGKEYVKFLGESRKWVPSVQSSDLKRKMFTCLEHLNAYHISLFLNVHVHTRQANEYLAEIFVQFAEKSANTDLERRLVSIYHAIASHLQSHRVTSARNELVEKFRQLLIDQYKSKPDSRTLVFVYTREMTVALKRFVDQDDLLKDLNPGRLVSANAQVCYGGLTVINQKSILEEFRSGHRKILICTTVAEEGLDVAECNLVIKYNHVTNEIAMVQRRGRGRAADSRSVLLAAESWIAKKEETNELRERLGVRAIGIIQKMSENEFSKKVSDAQREMRLSGLPDPPNDPIQFNSRSWAGYGYEIRCRKCDYLICYEGDVVLCNNAHVVADKNIFKTLFVDIKKTKEIRCAVKASDLSVDPRYDFLCPSCNRVVGAVSLYDKAYWMCLKMNGICFATKQNGILVKTVHAKWSKVPFKPRNVTMTDVEAMRSMFRA